ncbi:WEB family protein chloroplastic-like [Dorcoceras hygrometricum]|uniref:WEB family protein chloroplastic-like n=1 Tax=Dorcoceras hygrometricum TaxID=472368 RepID=A0A2Z7C244_9LAMI|nr:WEB family protein chloroplastic-like [Dorcoceras hygrometricum]
MHAPPPTRDSAPFPTPVLSAPATMAGDPSAGPPPGTADPNLTDIGSNHGRTRDNGSREVGTPAMPHDAPPSTSTTKPGSLDHLATLLPQLGPTMSLLGTSRTEPQPLKITPTEASREGIKAC